jgi:hypothetical protein
VKNMKTHFPQVERLRREAEEVLSGYKKAVKALYRDGVAKYPDDRMEELQRHYKAERNRALKSIEEAANELAQEALREAELAAQFPPHGILAGHERSFVTSNLPLVEADVAALTVDELVARLRGVLHDSSPSTRLLYWQAAKKRQRELKESRRGTSSALTPLDEPLRQIDEALFGEERRRRGAPRRQLAEAAGKVAEKCLFGRHDAKSLYGVYAAQSEGYSRPSGGSTSDNGAGFAGGRIADVRSPSDSEATATVEEVGA